MKTAALYARFSCSKQREASIEDQLRVCREWCAREGYRVVAEYCDEAKSGRTDDRPEFQRMVANAGESDIVLVYMMDRFSRDIYDAPIYKKKLRDAGVKVVSATESLPDGPEAMLMESMYEAMAAMESEKIGRRTKRGMEGNAMKCLWNGVRVYGYGVDEEGRYTVDEDQAAVVREAFKRRIGGESAHSIAADLARRGVRSYAGNPVGHTFVWNMLKNEKYTGVYMWGDVRVEGGMPAIIDPSTFAKAQSARVVKRRATEQWGDFVLAGKAVCAACGTVMQGVSGRGRGGRKYEYYKCGAGCGCKPVRADWLEGACAGAVRSLLDDRDAALQAARAVESYIDRTSDEAALNAARRRRDKAQQGMRNVMDAVANGLNAAIAQEKLDELEIELGVAVGEVTMLENAARFDAEDFADFLQFGTTFDDRAVLDSFVWQVEVDDSDVSVSLAYEVGGTLAETAFPNGSKSVCSGVAQSPENASEKQSNQVSGEGCLVRTDSFWLPVPNASRNVELGFDAGARRIILRFSRAA
ncbi:MAG TPA: hypothetical protein DCP91_08535 [Eggerthellaceae bacterium]|nr:hypothetical protein [Eggerthellaceae bacterium]